MQPSSQKQKLFERLHASNNDFYQALFCARYLLKKGWHSKPWERRGSIYEQQTAFVTTLIVAYARPFTKSKGRPDFPKRLMHYDPQQCALHKQLLEMRHQIFAHSDSKHFSFTPIDFGGVNTTIEEIPFAVLSADDTEQVRGMINQLVKATTGRLDALRGELINGEIFIGNCSIKSMT